MKIEVNGVMISDRKDVDVVKVVSDDGVTEYAILVVPGSIRVTTCSSMVIEPHGFSAVVIRCVG